MNAVKKVVRYELKLWLALFRWIVRYRGPGQQFSYAGAITPILWTFIAISALEIPAFHLLLPWESVRAVLDVIGVYGLLWMIGLMAAIRVNRHALTDEGLRIRNNITIDLTLPWDAIASVRARTRTVEKSKTVQVEDDALSINVAHQTSVEVTLREPREVLGHTVSTIRLYADHADEMVTSIRTHMGEETQRVRAR
jgi:hypothetical protein